MQANVYTRERKESTLDQYGQGSLALIPCLLLKVLHVKLLEILEVFGS
jgi:hypothetical protein